MTEFEPSCLSDSDVLAVFQEELARAAHRPVLPGAGPAIWPRFAAYYRSLARLPRRIRRSLQRRWRRSLGGLALLCALGQAPTFAATINVDGASCTLVDAITAANTDGPVGGCTAGSSADVIVLPPNSTHMLTAVNNTSFGSPNGLPLVTSTITIDGNGSTIIRQDGSPEFRVLPVSSNGNLTLQETTITGGRAATDFPERGGGVYNDGTLSLVNSRIVGNFALREGGGVYNQFGGTLRLVDSTVSGNSATEDGGGIYNRYILNITNSTVSGNSATQDGGGVFNSRTMTLSNSTVSGNLSRRNGGGLNNIGTMTLTNSTVSGNSATQDGGGLRTSRTVTVTTSTIARNSASQDGGGVYHAGGSLFLNETLISGNAASSLGPELYRRPSGTTINANRFNLFGYGGDPRVTNFTPVGTDIVPDEALTAILDTVLRDNGGFARTHALVPGSPAINAGGSCSPLTDQRGVPRVDANGDGVKDCDIGAFEVAVTPPPPPPPQADLSVTKTDSPDPVFEGQPLTYTLTVRNNGPNDAAGVTVTDPLPGGVVFVSAAASRGGCSGTATVTCFLGSLANGASATVTIVVTPIVVGALSNTANVAGSPSDLNPGDNSAASATTVLAIPPIRSDLALTHVDAPDPGAVADPLVYTLTVMNHGPSPATGVQLTDTLPPGVVLAGPPIPSQGTCSGTGPVVCQLGTLASGASAAVTINVLPAQAGTASNAASVVGVEPDIAPGNNSASNTTTINQVAVLPSPQGNCSRSACAVRLTCTLGAPCAGRRATLFVSVRNVRRGEAAAIRATNRIKFASGVTNVPPGGTATVRLRPTSRAKPIIRTSRKKRLSGVLEIRNTAGAVVSNTPIRIRLR